MLTEEKIATFLAEVLGSFRPEGSLSLHALRLEET